MKSITIGVRVMFEKYSLDCLDIPGPNKAYKINIFGVVAINMTYTGIGLGLCLKNIVLIVWTFLSLKGHMRR